MGSSGNLWWKLDSCQIAGIVLSWAQKFIFGGLDSRMPGTSLFIDMAGNIPFHSTEVKKYKFFFLVMRTFSTHSL